MESGVRMKNCSHHETYLFLIMASILLSYLTGCSKEKVNFREMTIEDQFAYAKRIFDKKDYLKAKTQLTVIVMNNPGSRIIDKAQYYLAECHYNLKEYIQASAEYEKLIRSLPQSPFVDDASYKIGLCYFELSPNFGLDQEYTYKAISQFQQFLEDYPNSDLKPEVEKNLVQARSKIAKKEFETGELYRKMGHFRAAIISFNAVLESFYDTKYASDALYWKGECYRRLGEWDEAKNVFQELLEKYGQSSWVPNAQEKLKEVVKKEKKMTEKKSEESKP